LSNASLNVTFTVQLASPTRLDYGSGGGSGSSSSSSSSSKSNARKGERGGRH
jgi:hypothetical protein